MIRLRDSRDSHYRHVIRVNALKRKEEEERELARELVVAHCHLGNLGELPPSPKVLAHKAWLLGLL